MVAALGEFVGTFMFLYLAYTGHLLVVGHATPTLPEGMMTNRTAVFISLTYNFSLLVNVWAFYHIGGGLFNPTPGPRELETSLSGQLPRLRAVFLVPAQLAASLCAGGLVSAMYRGGNDNSGIAAANTKLAPTTTIAQGCFIEMFLTAEIFFVALMLTSDKSRDTFLAPVGIGLTLFVAMLVGVPYTGASLNPARSFGRAFAARSFPGHHWIYWVGPALGALLGARFYLSIEYPHYKEVNEGQDAPVDERESA